MQRSNNARCTVMKRTGNEYAEEHKKNEPKIEGKKKREKEKKNTTKYKKRKVMHETD